jgi:hypothetical protein
MFKVTVLSCILILAIFAGINAQTSPSVVAEPVIDGTAMYYNHGSHVARTSDGKLFVVWADPENDGQIVYSQYDPSFQIWNPAVALSNNPAGGTVAKTAIAADDNGNLYVVWQQRNVTGDDYTVFLSKYNGVTWSTPSDLTGALLENEEANVAVGNDGKVFVVWNTDSEADGDEWIFCINSTDGGSTWSATPDTLSDPSGFMTSSIEIGRVNLARGTGGKMVATWFEATPDGVQEEIHMRQYDGAQWSDVMVVSDTTTKSNRYSHAALDAADNIYIVWRPQIKGTNATFLLMKHKAWSDVSWPTQADTVAAPGQIVSRPTMVIDSNDNLFVAYQRDVEADTTYLLDEIALVASDDGGATWTTPVALSRPDHDAGYQGMDPRVTSSGIDLAWRESYFINQNDPDSSAIVYGHVDLSVVGLGENEPQFAEKFSLSQNFPNPFNPTTQISFNIAKIGQYELNVFNVIGQKIRTIVNKEFNSGLKTVSWNGLNDEGLAVGSGIYFYKLSGNGIELTKKMVLIR